MNSFSVVLALWSSVLITHHAMGDDFVFGVERPCWMGDTRVALIVETYSIPPRFPDAPIIHRNSRGYLVELDFGAEGSSRVVGPLWTIPQEHSSLVSSGVSFSKDDSKALELRSYFVFNAGGELVRLRKPSEDSIESTTLRVRNGKAAWEDRKVYPDIVRTGGTKPIETFYAHRFTVVRIATGKMVILDNTTGAVADDEWLVKTFDAIADGKLRIGEVNITSDRRFIVVTPNRNVPDATFSWHGRTIAVGRSELLVFDRNSADGPKVIAWPGLGLIESFDGKLLRWQYNADQLPEWKSNSGETACRLDFGSKSNPVKLPDLASLFYEQVERTKLSRIYTTSSSSKKLLFAEWELDSREVTLREVELTRELFRKTESGWIPTQAIDVMTSN